MEEMQAISAIIDRLKQSFDPAQMTIEELARIVSTMDTQVNELAALSLKAQMDWAAAHPAQKPEPTLAEREENTAKFLHSVDRHRREMKRAKIEDPEYYRLLCGLESETDTPLQAKQREYLRAARPDLFDRYQLGGTEPNQTIIE